MQDRLRIGELARMARVSPKTIRYYEGIGLLPQPERSFSGYRLYSSVDLQRLSLIRRSKLLGLSLHEIKGLVGYAMDGQCEYLQQHLLDLLRCKRVEIDRQIEELLSLRDTLHHLEVEVAAKLVVGEWRQVPGGSCTCLDGAETAPAREETRDIVPQSHCGGLFEEDKSGMSE